MVENEIVKFGKYKNKPIEVMMLDTQYCKWLVSQSWFKDKFINVYNTIINYNTNENNDTPEHNKMQIKFLNVNYRIKVLKCLYPDTPIICDEKDVYLDKIIRECPDVIVGKSEKNINMIEIKQKLFDYFKENFHRNIDVIFEEGNIDVILRFDARLLNERKIVEIDEKLSWKIDTNRNILWYDKEIRIISLLQKLDDDKYINIELKPTISDDFPSILRKMDRKGIKTLIVGEYTGVGATKEEFIEYFKTSNIRVIFENEIE